MNNTNETIVVELEYILNAPVEDVFKFIGNPENDSQWQSSCDFVELLEPTDSVRSGTQYDIGFSFLTRKMRFQAEVTKYVPCSEYGYRSLSGPMLYEGCYKLEKDNDCTRVNWRFEAVPGKFFGIIPRSVIKKTLQKRVTEDVKSLQSIIEHETDRQTS